jgi:thioredoxin-related protein
MKVVLILFVFLYLILGCKKESTTHIVSSTASLKSKSIEQISKKDSIKIIAGLPWHSDIKSAFTLAKKEKKNVIIMVEENSCKWCRKMKELTLTDKQVQEKLKTYILVAVKRSDKNAITQIPEFDGNIPSFFFMKTDQELIEPVVGYFEAKDFLHYIKEIEE